MREAGETSGRGRTLLWLTALHAINDLYGLVLPPLLPVLRSAFDLSYGQLGIIPFVGTGISSLLQAFLGYAADRRRKRRVFVAVGFVGFALAMLALSFANSYGAILFAAALLGLAASTYHPQASTFLLHYFPTNRGFAQGIHGLGNGIGFLIAPVAVAALVPTIGWQWTVRLLAVPALVGAVLVGLVLREPPVQGGRGLLAGITRPVVLLTVVNGLGMAAAVGFLTWLPSYYNGRGYSLSEAGFLTAAMVAAGIAAQPVGGALSDRIGRRAVVLVSLLGVALFQTLFIVTDLLPLMVVASLLAGFCSSLLPPVAMVYASELASGGRSGTAVGVVWGLGTSLSALAPPLSGAAIDRFGFVAAYAGLSMAAVVAVLLGWWLPRAQGPTTGPGSSSASPDPTASRTPVPGS